MDEILDKDTNLFNAIPAVTGGSRVITPSQTTQRSWETPALPYVLLIETSGQYILATDDNGFGILIS